MPFVRTAWCAVALLVSGRDASGQSAPTFTDSSYLRARRVLDRGIAALGGLDAFRLVDDIHFQLAGTVTEIGQSSSPDATYYQRPLESEGEIDLLHKRYYQIRKTNYIGSGPRWSSVVTTERTGFTTDLRANAVYPLAPAAVAGTNAGVQRTFPHLVLQAALRRAGSLRWVGEGRYEGRSLDLVDYTDGDGAKLTLCFDAQTGVLTKTEALTDGLLQGLSATETIYTDYRTVNGVRVPFRVRSRVGGHVTSDLSYSGIEFNRHADSSLFAPPPNATTGPEVGGPRQPITLTKLGHDVYYVDAIETGGIFFYSAMFVVFNEYVLVLEAPLNDGATESIIAKIKQTAPGKPIRYVVPTHYHIDHTGGIRGYVAEGSTVVTTPGNRTFFESLARVAHPLNQDRLSLQPRPTSIETFDSKRVFTDADHVVELYSLGATSHVDEMIVAYLPHEHLAFVSDVFLVSYMGQNGAAEPSTVTFYNRIRALGLDIRTIAGGHGRIGTMEELTASVAAARK